MGVKEEKVRFVEALSERLKSSNCVLLTDYRGLTVAEMNELRKQLRVAGVEFQVIKNTMTRRAAAAAGIEGLDPMLVGPTAIAFSKEDVVAPAKILSKFAKEHEQLEIKGGLVEGKVVGLDEIKALADLPSREGLLSMLLSVLQAPIRNFALAVKAVAEKQEPQEA